MKVNLEQIADLLHVEVENDKVNLNLNNTFSLLTSVLNRDFVELENYVYSLEKRIKKLEGGTD